MQSTRREAIEALAERFAGALGGRPVATVGEAARLTDYSVSAIRGHVYRGRLRASRLARNGPLRIRVDELARVVIEGEERGLPALDVDAQEVRRERLAVARSRRLDARAQDRLR